MPAPRRPDDCPTCDECGDWAEWSDRDQMYLCDECLEYYDDWTKPDPLEDRESQPHFL